MVGFALSLLATPSARAQCAIPKATVQAIQATLTTVAALPDENGGIFKPNRVWSAVVDRQGILCSVTVTGDAWPGARAVAVAVALAETTNSFSNSGVALSTANLYAPTQAGGMYYGLNNANPSNPFLNQITTAPTVLSGVALNPGGTLAFGGGVALYQNGNVIGGLGVGGDSSCAGHAIAYRMRRLAGFDGIPGGVGPSGTDNIAYPLGATAVAGFQHPHCLPTDIVP